MAADDRIQGARQIGVLNGVRTFRDSVGIKDKNDYYSFTLNGRSRFDLSLNKLQNNVDVSLIQGRRVLFNSRRGGRKSETIAATLEAGTYHVRVYPRRGSSRYQLKLSSANLNPVTPLPAVPQLGAGTWLITGNDTSGGRWDGSTITFESQVPQGNNYSLSGYFNWVGDRGDFGRENFVGTLFANNQLQLSGTAIVPPASGIVTGIYNAAVTADGKNIVNGTWGGGGVIPGTWTAVQVIP